MPSTVEKIRNDGAKALELFATPIKAAEAGVMTLAGEPFLPKMKHEIAKDLWNVVAFPPRILKHLTVGLLKTTGALTWNMISRMRVLPLWSGESEKQKELTHQQLVALGKDLPTPMPLTSPEDALRHRAA